jgi:hypothetical protein
VLSGLSATVLVGCVDSKPLNIKQGHQLTSLSDIQAVPIPTKITPVTTNAAPEIVRRVTFSMFLRNIAVSVIVTSGYTATIGATITTGASTKARYQHDTPKAEAPPDASM